MEFVGLVVFMLLLAILLVMFGGNLNFAWIFCFLFLYWGLIEKDGFNCFPAAMFAIAGSIGNLKGDGKKND